ncbi:uncharacterized protein PFLUO_LOCUS5714 [Penicillium psychrofluorescens]|uniref:uncharacterized protein n=1 Tax=Penicillium psychrofluorescens TaxID=3158075 RepID=UPI003CCDAEFA
MGPVVVKLVKGVAAGIGLASEGIAARKAKKAQNTQAGANRGDLAEDESEVIVERDVAIDTLEEQWALDEAQEELRQTSYPQDEPPPYSEVVDGAALATWFASQHPTPMGSVAARLPAPILLPQRRPKDRNRGFLRAYAPDLAPFGIDQATFLEFLNTAEKGCRAHRWLQAINLAALVGHAIPSVAAIAVSVAIHQFANLTIAADGRRRTNNFFDQANEEFFQPRGLYCLVLTWIPEEPDAPAMSMDLQSTVAKAMTGNDSTVLGSNKLRRLQQKFKTSDGKNYGNPFPEVAPLVFPELDRLENGEDAEKQLSKTKRRVEFVKTYLDKRAQATFQAENPDSHLNQRPKATFASRYADPNHAASSGDLLSLVTGGYASRGRRGGGGGGGLIGGLAELIRDPQGLDRETSRNAGGRAVGPGANTLIGGGLVEIRKLFEGKVIYLAIVNMPSKAEMREARDALGLPKD